MITNYPISLWYLLFVICLWVNGSFLGNNCRLENRLFRQKAESELKRLNHSTVVFAGGEFSAETEVFLRNQKKERKKDVFVTT